MPSIVWKGHLTFGLVSIPLRLYAAARSQRVEFHQLHRTCRTRLKRPLYCPTCNRMVEKSEVAKGYEFEKGQYVFVDEEEIKKLIPESAGTMEILEFVPLAEIDPLYYDASYLASPEKPGQKAYQLLVTTIEETSKVAVAKVVMHQREYLAAIRARRNGLMLHTMFFSNEIREAPRVESTAAGVRAEEVKLAKELVTKMATHFKPEKYRDEYQEKLRAALAAKSKGKKLPVARERKGAAVIDMMEALRRSVPRAAAQRRERHAGRGGKTVKRAS